MNKIRLPILLSSLAITTLANASSHREAPNIARSPALDSTDFYAFNSYEEGRDGFVTLIANYIPLQDAYGGPNYFAMDPAAVYAIHIDNDGDAMEDLTFTWQFTSNLAANNEGIALNIGPADNQRAVKVPLKNIGPISADDMSAANFSESYTFAMIEGGMRDGTKTMLSAEGSMGFAKPLDYIGNKTFSSAAEYARYADQFVYNVSVPNCEMPAQVFVGQRKDPFVVNLGKTFDLVNYVPVEGDSAPGANDAGGFPGGITQDDSNDDLADKNVTSIALEIHASCITGDGNGTIGTWTTASLPQGRVLNPNATFSKPDVQQGPLTQVSRLGNPLVNELVIGIGDKDRFSTAHPKDDGQFADYVTHPALPELLNILFKDAVNTTLGANLDTLAPTNIPRIDLVTAFLTGFPGVNQLATVTPSEMLRLNTGIPATPADEQSWAGVAGDDLAGFPNGRRPGDDVVDIALRVVMGRLCYPIPVNGTDTDLGLCTPDDANVGTVPFTDGAPLDASMMDSTFPYLATPLPGSEQESTMKRLSLLSLAVLVSLTGCFDSSDDDNTAQNTNRAPEADSRALTTQTEVAITDQLNATDADGDSLTYAVSTGPMFGTLSLSSDGAFTYTPDGEYTGTDSFSYTVSDGTAFAVTGFIDITVEVLEVSFNDTVRTVFTLDANAEPVSVNGREYIEDANSPGNFDDLLDN